MMCPTMHSGNDRSLVIMQDQRVLQKLHRRVFLDKLRRDELTIYMSFYLEAANRDAFMAVREDMYLAFVGCCRRHGAQLAVNKLQVELNEGWVGADAAMSSAAAAIVPEMHLDSMDSPQSDIGLQPFNPNNPFPDGHF